MDAVDRLVKVTSFGSDVYLVAEEGSQWLWTTVGHGQIEVYVIIVARGVDETQFTDQRLPVSEPMRDYQKNENDHCRAHIVFMNVSQSVVFANTARLRLIFAATRPGC